MAEQLTLFDSETVIECAPTAEPLPNAGVALMALAMVANVFAGSRR